MNAGPCPIFVPRTQWDAVLGGLILYVAMKRGNPLCTIRTPTDMLTLPIISAKYFEPILIQNSYYHHLSTFPFCSTHIRSSNFFVSASFLLSVPDVRSLHLAPFIRRLPSKYRKSNTIFVCPFLYCKSFRANGHQQLPTRQQTPSKKSSQTLNFNSLYLSPCDLLPPVHHAFSSSSSSFHCRILPP